MVGHDQPSEFPTESSSIGCQDPTVHNEGRETVDDNGNQQRRLCLSFHGNKEAKGIMYGGVARGAISMSNVYLANSMIHLACRAAGGFGPDDRQCVNDQLEIYGMKPAALISNIAFVSGILGALVLPLFGAIIDYTPYRKSVGVGTAFILTLVTGIQIGTTSKTWFIMAILQAIIFMIYQVQVMVLFAYYPEVAREVGQKRINAYSSTWSFYQFLAQAGVNIVILGFSVGFKMGTVKTAMLSQGVVLAFCLVFLSLCWSMLPSLPSKHKLQDGHSLIFASFRQNLKTMKHILTKYKTGLRWFILSTVFGEAAASAVGTTAVIFLNGNLGLSAIKIGIFFEVSLIGVVVGTKVGMMVTKYTNPKISLMLSNLGLAITVGGGVWAVQDVPIQELSYIWGFTIGVFLGWFYPTENVFYSMCVPMNQEAEFSGFFGWASQIWVFVPPLVFTVLIQIGISLAWGLTVIGFHFAIAFLLLCLCSKWEDIVEETSTFTMNFSEDEDTTGNQAIENTENHVNGQKKFVEDDPERPGGDNDDGVLWHPS